LLVSLVVKVSREAFWKLLRSRVGGPFRIFYVAFKEGPARFALCFLLPPRPAPDVQVPPSRIHAFFPFGIRCKMPTSFFLFFWGSIDSFFFLVFMAFSVLRPLYPFSPPDDERAFLPNSPQAPGLPFCSVVVTLSYILPP